MKNLFVFLCFAVSQSVSAQQVTGYWYGSANVEISGIQNNYLTELIISQKGNKVKGFFGYYFKDVYQSFVVKGTYDPKTRQIEIRDIPIIYYMTNSTAASVDCITSFQGTLYVSKVKTELKGYFVRDKKYTYTCPDLRVNYTLFQQTAVDDSVFKDMVGTRTFWKPKMEDAVAGVHRQEEKSMTYLEPAKESAGSSKPITLRTPLTTKAMNVEVDKNRITDEFKKRKSILNKEIDVASDSVRLSFYDNAEIDGDSISVFMNKELVVTHQRLEERAFNLYVKLDSTKEENEISMFAENLGKYPPNTALMVISDGDKRYELFLSSDFKGNATVKFRRKKNAVAATGLK